ncbi:MAG: membrane dipeptidase [Eubacteriales bacterium]|nr:membrane dipeptidase [Eubacteriales bacterium]
MDYFDLHCDTIYELSRYAIYSKNGGTLRRNRGQLDLTRAARFGHYAQVFALFCGAKPVEDPVDAHARFTHLLKTAQQAFSENADCLVHCKTAIDFSQAKQQGKTAAFLSIEGAELLQSAEDIRAAIDAGVRIVTLTWNHRSIYGCGASTDNRAGLTAAGKQLAQDLSANGVFLDVSHLSECGFWDLAECISAPILATHSDSKAVCPHVRNLTDAQFREIVRRGGLVGINFYVPFLTKKTRAACDDILRHIEHFCSLGGEKNLSIGADWDGCDRLPDGISDITGMELLAEALARHGYSDEQIADLFYNNANRFVLTNF